MTKENNYLIVMVDGGFCSQLVKYTLGIFLKEKLSVDIKYDVSWFESHGMDCDNKFKRELLIKKVFPDIDFEIATGEEIRQARENHYITNASPYEFCAELLDLETPAYIDGYYESITYIDQVREQLYRDLDFSKVPLSDANQKMLALIKSSEFSCAVHVRRGDFVNLGLAILTPEYYVKAIRKMQERTDKSVHFFFFSNDMSYVQQSIISLCPDISYTLVDVNNNDTGYLDLFLISRCNAAISSNSSFGFWGSFLNRHPDRFSVFPAEWVPNQSKTIRDSAIVAHHLPNSIFLDKDGNCVQYNLSDKELSDFREHAYMKEENYFIENDPLKPGKICAVYFSSNSIFKTFKKNLSGDNPIIDKTCYEWYDCRYKTAKKHIFLCDVRMSLYQHGINSVSSDINKLLALLKKETDGYKTVCFGAAEGGYAAALFSCLLNAEKCFIFSPCLNIKEYLISSRKFIHLSEFNAHEYDTLINNPVEYNDIPWLIANSVTEFFGVLSIYNAVDAVTYREIENTSKFHILRLSSAKSVFALSRIMNSILINLKHPDVVFDNVCNSEFALLKKLPYYQQIVYLIVNKISHISQKIQKKK